MSFLRIWWFDSLRAKTIFLGASLSGILLSSNSFGIFVSKTIYTETKPVRVESIYCPYMGHELLLCASSHHQGRWWHYQVQEDPCLYELLLLKKHNLMSERVHTKERRPTNVKLFHLPSLKRKPSEPVLLARSDPARSTKCNFAHKYSSLMLSILPSPGKAGFSLRICSNVMVKMACERLKTDHKIQQQSQHLKFSFNLSFQRKLN